MISWIIFGIGVVLTYLFGYLFLGATIGYLNVSWIAAVSIVGMIALNGVAAIICSKLIPNKFFDGDKKFYFPSKKECKFYEKIGLKKWKDKTLDMGALNGFKKDKIVDSPEYIERFILENKKGYLTHFTSVFVSVFAIVLLPLKFWLSIGLPVVVTSLILNVIPMMILRYNMPRLKTMLKFSLRNSNK